MSTTIGNRLINGGAVKYHSTQGSGLGRTIASKAFELGANAAVQKLAKMIKGDGYRVTGTGRKAKTHRKKRC